MFENPLVVGYKGEIGSFMLQGLLRTMPKANNIWCIDVNNSEEEVLERIKKSDAIFLCVPLNKTHIWLEKYKKLIKDKHIFEQTSYKNGFVGDLAKEFDKMISMHILFKPSMTDKKDRRCAIIDTRQYAPFKMNTEWENILEYIKEITESSIIFYDSFEDHDLAMAEEQALVHRTLVILDSYLKGSTFMSSEVKKLAKRIKSNNIELLNSIQENYRLQGPLESFIEKLKKNPFIQK